MAITRGALKAIGGGIGGNAGDIRELQRSRGWRDRHLGEGLGPAGTEKQDSGLRRTDDHKLHAWHKGLSHKHWGSGGVKPCSRSIALRLI